MELNVNSPAYYKDLHGIDDEVYRFFQKAYTFFLDKEYSSTLKIVGVFPIVVPDELYNSGLWKESLRLVNHKSCAIVSLRINFEKYDCADSVGKIQLTKETILKALRKLRSKVDFDYETFERDLNQFSID